MLLKKKLLSFILVLFILSAFTVLNVSADEVQQSLISHGSATIDGVISDGEWDSATRCAIDRAVTKDCKNGTCTEGASSLSFRVMWDADYLYLLIELFDDQLVINENTGTSYRNDCLFVYVGENASNHADYSASTYMLCFFPYLNESDYDGFSENGKSGTIICRNGSHNVSGDQYKCTATAGENGYTVLMEAAIAWNGIEPVSGDSISFDLQYNDANSDLYGSTSNNREAIWSWSAVGSDNKGPNNNKGAWGTLNLIDPNAPVTPPATEEPTPPATEDQSQGTDSAPPTTTAKPGGTTEAPSTQSNSEAPDSKSPGIGWIILAVCGVLVLTSGIVMLIITKDKKNRRMIAIIVSITAVLLALNLLFQFVIGPAMQKTSTTTAPWEGPDVITYTTEDESGYDLWLRYEKIASANYIKKAQHYISYVVTPDTSRAVIDSAYKELLRGLPGLYGIDSIPTAGKVENVGALILGTASDPAVAAIASANGLSITEKDGYLIKKVTVDGKDATLILGESDSGVLYGTFKLLELMATEAEISNLNISDAPKIEWRVLNQWDSWDGSIGGKHYDIGESIYDWDVLPEMPDTRIEDFARANASIGINTIVINNVNSSTNYIDTKYLHKVSAVADVFRRYGIRLGISISFDSPSKMGRLTTNDPLNKDVIKWWEDKTAEIYAAIPDFAGYLIKADSEGKPGPAKYGRTHAQGANMFADVLAPYGGIIMWRAFVYGDVAGGLSDDICNQAYEFFTPQDGKFKDNVVLQCKNGPRDFLPREPISPLFGGMKDTNMSIELQIKQEYTGQGTDLCYLVSQWKYYLNFDMMLDDGTAGVPTTLSQILQGNVYSQATTLVAGVANVGNCESWTNGLLAQANWYGFGRLAWDPDLTEEEITETWVKMTFNTNEEVVNTVSEILYGSWELYEAYTSPYSMGMTFELDIHFDPDLPYRNSNGTISVNRTGVGNNRNSTARGNHTDATAQYSPRLQALLNDIDTCPEELICWFHHVPSKRVMSNGQTLIGNIYEGLAGAPQAVKDMKASIASLKGKIDDQRLQIMLKDFDEQYDHSVLWSQTMIEFFEEQTRVECTVKNK